MGNKSRQKNNRPERNGDLGFFFRGQKMKQRREVKDTDDEYSDEGGEGLVCSTIGRQWEYLPFPIVTDSGACASVLATDWCGHVNRMKHHSQRQENCLGRRMAERFTTKGKSWYQ